jgi:phosphoglycolate phosphatase-like HAD superfamily hydrolase
VNGKKANLPHLRHEFQTIFVDVDGTIHHAGIACNNVIAWCRRRKAEGHTLILWTARGESHAVEAVERFGLHGIFSHVIGKPTAVLDDKGLEWLRYVSIVRDITT